jgi:two-component system heavy metal sensor histidine kinase CusS
MLRQALINIVKNGLEANPDRKVHFVVSVVVAENSIELSIANDGVPVPRELAPRMFDPYVSGGAAKDNMGLGLAIVRKIMLEHGGDAVYRDREGHPEFVLTLPRIDA